MAGINVREWGSGDRAAVLIHGLGNSSTSWWEVGPEFAERGFHVYAVDLPGHGASAPASEYTVQALVDAVVSAVPSKPAVAVGHSLGGLVLAHAVTTLQPGHAVYVDPAFRVSADQAIVGSFRAQKDWTLSDVETAFPRWSSRSHELKLEALRQWDPAILDALATLPAADVSTAAVPSTLVLADPSALIPPHRAAELEVAGFEVRVVPGTGHVVHLDDRDGFLAAIKDVIAR
ncbi:alpha/beta fold hydrolase [Rhodococcus sp. Eu-32]|uniref:alpha/beta fold hydrolase n=1 Tax=Rhodococcus sp. Eu-32 TaxID=1017319 RepID=UPI000DF357B7|nr:alpha/beta hydrolase [Rhodococcus sp. Eu-32]RRQ29409.1 alpha/beta fold hydrolase [Rhodococcus sp. Eu-32]